MKIVLLAISIVILFGCKNRQASLKTGFEGKPLPAFNLLLTDSSTYINTANIPMGKPVVLFYFSPRCVYCKAQMDNIIKEMTSLKDIHFYIFTAWPFPEMKTFYNHYQLNKYPNVTVGFDYDDFFENHYRITGIPYLAIFKKDKILNKAFMGNVDPEQIKELAYN